MKVTTTTILDYPLEGYIMDDGDELWIPVIVCREPGEGHVGRFLDGLPTDRTINVPNVPSEKLAGMLLRRGFKLGEQWVEDFDDLVTVYKRKAK